MTINDVTLELPGSVQPLLDAGWVFKDEADETRMLAPGEQASFIDMINEYGTISVTLVNQGLNTQPVSDCTLTMLWVLPHLLQQQLSGRDRQQLHAVQRPDAGYLHPAGPSGACPDAVKDDILEDTYVREDETSKEEYTFNKDGILSGATLTVSKDVKSASAAGDQVSRERPAEYDDPAFMEAYGLQDFSVQSSLVSGTLPLTVEDFTNQGWTVERQPDYLPANSYANVYLRYDVRTTLEVQAANYTGNAIDPKYGMIKDLTYTAEEEEDTTLQYQGKTWVELGKTTRQQALDTAKELGLNPSVNELNQVKVELGDNGRSIFLVFNQDDVLLSVTVHGEYGGSSYNYESEETNG